LPLSVTLSSTAKPESAMRSAHAASSRRTSRARIAFAAAFAIAALSIVIARPKPLPIPTFANVTVHDPSVVRVGSSFYVFGSHLASARTDDWMRWTQITTDRNPTQGNALMPDAPVQLQEALAWTGSGAAHWAPDVIQLEDGRFYFYYCVGRLDAPRAALGVAVADSPTGPYTNLGLILRSGMFGQPSPDGTNYDATRHPNTVDPDVFFDRDGRLWMVYGSYSGGIFILELDRATGFPLPGQAYGRKLIGGNHARIEGAFMLYSPESDYYYLFLSFGGLASDGGYNIRVGRARLPEGPFHDAEGNDLTNVAGAPGTLFDDASIAPFGVKLMGNWRFSRVDGEPATSPTGYLSPGHNSAFYDPASRRHFLVFHTRFAGRGEEHQVRVHQLYMNADGWPVAAPHRYAGEGLPLLKRNNVPGDYKVINHGKAISPALNTSGVIKLHPNGTVTGAASGRWTFAHDGNDFTITLDGVAYRGVFSTQWDDENGAWVYSFSALSRKGVAVWGSHTVVAKGGPTFVALPGLSPLYGQPFTFDVRTLFEIRQHVYSYSIVTGPAGLTIDRVTGVLSWRPSLSDAGVPYEVTVRALWIEAGAPHEIRYTFTVTATSQTVVRRLDLDFSGAASAGVRDGNGVFTGFTTRLPGTGAALPESDPNLQLDPASGVLVLRTTQADFFGRAGLPGASSPGVALAALGYTGSEDFAVTAHVRSLTGIQFIDQVGLYVGASSDALTRAGTIVFAAPERYAVHSQNGADHSGRFFGFGFNGADGMTVTITREAGVWRYFVDGVEWNPLAAPAFLDGRADLIAGVFAITPLNANPKTIELDAYSLVVATSEPRPQL
jgi:arabinan endo-1,5-alpha-L-arabinosidase